MESYGTFIPLPNTHNTHQPHSLAFRFGRDNFQEAMKISVRAESPKIDWTKFKFMVFDMPNHKGTYAERYAALGKVMLSSTFCIEAHFFLLCY